MGSLRTAVDDVAHSSAFSGVVRVDRAGRTELLSAHGSADRAHAVPNTVATRFATASGTKTLTALTVMALVERGTLHRRTTARSLLRDDLPLVADDVTVEHLLAHRSGIGDYLDEDAVADITDHVMPVPVHRLATTEDYLLVLEGHPTRFPAGERFSYNNGGYVLLALLAERASGVGFHDLVRRLVCEPAGMTDTAFLRSDALPGRAALGYLAADGLRTNVLHLPVVGSGDGGAYSTVADLHRLWESLHAGRVVTRATLDDMLAPHSLQPEADARYGLGFHLHASTDTAWLEGYDAGVSCASVHRPSESTTYTVLSNWTDGAWPLLRAIGEQLDG